MASEKLKQALCASAREEYFYIDCEPKQWEPSAQFQRKMERLLQQYRKQRIAGGKRVFLIAAIILLLSVTVLFSVADVREKVIRFFVQYSADHFELEYGVEKAGDIPVGEAISEIYFLTGLPEGFTQESKSITDHSVTTVWTNGEETLIFSQGDGLTTRSVDNERLKKSTVAVNGTTVLSYSEPGYVLLMWNTQTYTFCVDYYGVRQAEELAQIVLNGLQIQ